MAAHIFYGSICVHFCQFMDETGAPNYSNFVDECACCKSGGTTVCGGRVWGCICIRKSGASRIIAKSIVRSCESKNEAKVQIAKAEAEKAKYEQQNKK